MSILGIAGLRGLLAVSVASLLAASCIYDPDHRCGPNQHLGPNSSCACDDGLILQGQTCVPCGDNMTWQSGVCVCNDGYTHAQPDAGTVDVDGGLGACVLGGPGTSCDPSEMPTTMCNDAPYSTCRDRGGGIGYCTSLCTADSDCAHGFVCDTTASPGTCKSSAVGQGDPCTTSDDCKGKDANYCESTIVHLCIVVGCSVQSPLSCSEGFECCDVTPLGLALTLCIPEGKCPTKK
ncbi:MAG TPA: hypothetical protein VGF76_10970 [Polyangiaceae bacterium]